MPLHPEVMPQRAEVIPLQTEALALKIPPQRELFNNNTNQFINPINQPLKTRKEQNYGNYRRCLSGHEEDLKQPLVWSRMAPRSARHPRTR
jgi:hypothetical protein